MMDHGSKKRMGALWSPMTYCAATIAVMPWRRRGPGDLEEGSIWPETDRVRRKIAFGRESYMPVYRYRVIAAPLDAAEGF